MYILNSVILLFSMSLILGIIVAFFAKVFEIKEDPRIAQILAVLPAYNCGACGYPGCSNYATSIIMEHVPPNKCSPGGPEVKDKIQKILDGNK